LFGYDIGATSFVLKSLVTNEHSSYTKTYDPNSIANASNSLNEVWWQHFAYHHARQGITIAAGSLGAFLGSHIVLFYLAHWMSRRAELRVASFLYVTGTILNILSGTWWKEELSFGWYALLLGRMIFGVGVGFVMRKSILCCSSSVEEICLPRPILTLA
jgi:MFS family permease